MERLRFLRKQINMTQTELARRLHITQGALNHYEKGITEPSIEKLNQLAEILHTTVDFLVERTDKQCYPVLGTIAAGQPILADCNIEEYQEFDFNPSLDKQYYVLNVKGESMYPFYLNGDRVLVESGGCSEPNKKTVYAVRVGDEATMKMVHKQPNGMMLVAHNTDAYSPTFYTPEQCMELPVEIIGTVKALSRVVRDE